MGRTLAIIPARGGSAGLPGKNIRRFAGLPLIAHSILMARMCPDIDRCVISTDSPEIADVARGYAGDVPFLRPAALAEADTPIWLVLRHALGEVEAEEGFPYDYVVLLDPTSPTRLPEYVSEALARVKSTPEADGIVSVSQPEWNPIWHGVVDHDGWMADFVSGAARYTRRQGLPAVYRINGLVYVWRGEFMRTRASWREQARLLLYITPEPRAVSIDDLDQFRRAELMVTSGLLPLPWLGSSPPPS
jgi:CMP-N,N'-diacetyllegionaminic acid synthase